MKKFLFDSADRTRTTAWAGIRLGIALFILVIIFFVKSFAENNIEEIHFWTSDTKAEWVLEVTGPFNEAQHQTSDGKPIFVHVHQSDSGEVLPMLKAGEIMPTVWSPGTIAWVNEANVEWQDLHGRPLVSGDCSNLVYTAIGIGMWRPMAEAMGWPDQPIGWGDIIELAADPEGWTIYGHPEWGQFKFGHTNPGSSNTGFLAMTSLVYNILGITEGLTPEMAKSNEVVEAFEKIEANTYHYGVSTRSLFTKIATRGPAYLHAGTNSEIGVMATNYYNELAPPWELVFIIPADGTFWSENPYCVLDTDWVTDGQREAAAIYLDYLLGSEAQETAIDEWLRPIDLTKALRAPLTFENGIDPNKTPMNVPSLESVSGDTAAAIQDVFLLTKKPATIIVLIDTSGSMRGDKLGGAFDGTIAFLESLHRDDKVQIVFFSDNIWDLGSVQFVGDIAEEFRRASEIIQASGNTRLYDAVCQTVEELDELKADDEESDEQRLYGIVLLSDGQDTGSNRSRGTLFSGCLPPGESADTLKIFSIAYGEDADEELLEQIADQTNGRFYTSDPDDIEEIYRQIAFEQ